MPPRPPPKSQPREPKPRCLRVYTNPGINGPWLFERGLQPAGAARMPRSPLRCGSRAASQRRGWCNLRRPAQSGPSDVEVGADPGSVPARAPKRTARTSSHPTAGLGQGSGHTKRGYTLCCGAHPPQRWQKCWIQAPPAILKGTRSLENPQKNWAPQL